jgi:hypothetical protein
LDKIKELFLFIVLIVIVVVFGVFGSMLVWNWVVPDVFSGAVKQGLLPASLTFWQSFKLSILTMTFLGLNRLGSSQKD